MIKPAISQPQSARRNIPIRISKEAIEWVKAITIVSIILLLCISPWMLVI